MGNKTMKIGKKSLKKGILLSLSAEIADAMYLRRKGKRVYVSYFYYECVSKGVIETAILVRKNGKWIWEKKFDNPSILLWMQRLVIFPTPVMGWENRCNPVKNFRLFKYNWKCFVSLPVPMQETL